jgi:hypothetical protein
MSQVSYSHAGDAELLTRAVVDPEAFGAFYDRFEARVLAFFYRATRRADIAADVTAETFAAALAVMVIALTSLGHRRTPAGATTPPAQPAVPSRQAAAYEAATNLLDRLVLPPGAVRAPADPSSPARLGRPEVSLGMPNAVGVRRFWRLPGAIEAATEWLQSHPPAGGQLRSTQEAGSSPGRAQKTVIELWGGTYAFSRFPAGVTSQQLVIEIAPTQGGGVAMRADGQAGWVLPRPVAQQLPTGINRIRVSTRIVAGSSAPVKAPARRGAQVRPMTYDITSPQRVADLVALFNLIPPAPRRSVGCVQQQQPGRSSGPASLAIDLAFYSAGQNAPLAWSTIDGPCKTLELRIAGRPRQVLMVGFPGIQASKYDSLLVRLAANVAPLPPSTKSNQASSRSSGLKGGTVPPVQGP